VPAVVQVMCTRLADSVGKKGPPTVSRPSPPKDPARLHQNSAACGSHPRRWCCKRVLAREFRQTSQFGIMRRTRFVSVTVTSWHPVPPTARHVGLTDRAQFPEKIYPSLCAFVLNARGEWME